MHQQQRSTAQRQQQQWKIGGRISPQWDGSAISSWPVGWQGGAIAQLSAPSFVNPDLWHQAHQP
eukprot:2956907-Karenia_brevis.AAC.1